MKTTKFLLLLFCILFYINLFSQVEIPDNKTIKLGNQNVAVHTGTTGKYGQAYGFLMSQNNPPAQGVILECGISESGGFYADGDYAIIWSPGDFNRLLRIYDEDYMYSGSTTYEKAYFDGTGNLYQISDLNRKQNITQITDGLIKLKGLKGVQYNYIPSQKAQKPDNQKQDSTALKSDNKKYVGLLAQDVEKVIPEAVDTDEHGNKFVNYSGVIPIVVEAFKEQQLIIDNQNETIKTLTEELKKLKDDVEKLKIKN